MQQPLHWDLALSPKPCTPIHRLWLTLGGFTCISLSTVCDVWYVKSCGVKQILFAQHCQISTYSSLWQSTKSCLSTECRECSVASASLDGCMWLWFHFLFVTILQLALPHHQHRKSCRLPAATLALAIPESPEQMEPNEPTMTQCPWLLWLQSSTPYHPESEPANHVALEVNYLEILNLRCWQQCQFSRLPARSPSDSGTDTWKHPAAALIVHWWCLPWRNSSSHMVMQGWIPPPPHPHPHPHHRHHHHRHHHHQDQENRFAFKHCTFCSSSPNETVLILPLCQKAWVACASVPNSGMEFSSSHPPT